MPIRAPDSEFEPDRLLDIFGNDRPAVANILAEAAMSMREMIDQVSNEISSGDKQAVARLLHTLTGVSANIGANRLSALSGNFLEDIRRNRTFPADLVERLRFAYDCFAGRVQEYLATSDPSSSPSSPLNSPGRK